MSSNLYNIYRDKTLQLAKTLIIKSEDAAFSLNRGLMDFGVTVDEGRPETWMYYMNLAGEYHPINEMMYVQSLDTLEDIEFTKANLLEHRNTAREYYYGSKHYKSLVKKYPHQKALIRGIVDPVDINKAIAASDFAILHYDFKLVEQAETNLIPEIQRWINGVVRVHYNRGFVITESDYVASFLSMIFFQLPARIMTIRNANRHTERVHSFHLWSFLGGHNYLDDYREYLTRGQALWLYKNIRYIEKNVGKTETFEYLIENIMTRRGFPIGSYSMHQDNSEQPENLYPDIGLKFKPLNFVIEHEQITTERTLLEVLEKERSLAKFNPNHIPEDEQTIKSRITRALTSGTTSKVLESRVEDRALAQPIRLMDTLLNHWIYWSYNYTYATMISVQNPHNGEVIVMSAKDAVVAFYYCLNRSFGIRLKDIPDVVVWDVLKDNPPMFSQLRDLVNPHYVSDYILNEITKSIPTVRKMVSTENFYNKVGEIYKMRVAHREIYTLREHMYSRGLTEIATRHCLEDKRIPLVDRPTSFSQFFKDHGWDLEDLPETAYGALAQNIISTVTGQDLFYVKTASEIQTAMIRLLMQLSSYSVHVIQDGTTARKIVMDWAAIRLGNYATYGRGGVKHPWMPARILRTLTRSHASIDYLLTRIGATLRGTVKSMAEVRLDTTVNITTSARSKYRVVGRAPTVWFSLPKPVSIDTLLPIKELPGLIESEVFNDGVTLTKTELDGLIEKDK